MTVNKTLAAITVAVFATFAVTPPAAADGGAGAFSKGRNHFVASGGTGYAFGETYLVVGLGVRHFLSDGFNVGLSLESWTGANPGLTKVTPSVQYVFYRNQRLNPYIGGFYRRTYIEDLPDIDSVGGRGGVYFSAGRNAYIGIGAVYERYIDCRKGVYRSCSDTYPEVSFTFVF
jgi:hypothetical protein